MIKTKLWCIALSLSACALSGCSGASEFDGEPAADAASEGAAESIGQTQQALWNLCEKVRIEVTNDYEEAGGARPDIKVTALSYYDADRGKWSLQWVKDQVISYDQDYPFTESLENSDGNTITKWRVYHQHDLGNGWGGEVYQEINTADVNCRDGMTVKLTVNL